MNLRPILHVVRVVVASPGDVQPERNALVEVVDELNRTTAKERGLHIDLVRWETDVNPGFHIKGPQELIDLSLKFEDCDLLIGIFWKRFGKPTKDAQSGTEHEFRKAYEAWKRNNRPQLMIYFKEKPYWANTSDELNQQRLVMNFKSSISEESLYSKYTEKSQFVKMTRVHLTRFIWNTPVSDVTSNNSNTITNAPPIEEQISQWLQAKASHSGETYRPYKYFITYFRDVLREHDLDLNNEEVVAISAIFQEWADMAVRKPTIKPRTYNQRLSIIRSFYKFALKQHWMKINPIEMVERRIENAVDAAKPIEVEKVNNYLKSIPRSARDGKRNYALLCVLLTTGARSAEIAGLQCSNIAKTKSGVTITTQQKGGGNGSYTLHKFTAQALIDFLTTIYGNDWPAAAPVWPSFARNKSKGKAISKQTLSDICKKWLHTTKVESTKRTYEAIKNDYGVKGIENIENLLGINAAGLTEQPKMLP